ncbi:DUF4233 domain-containing protein [Nakamurella antarctica]|nr:DUF4233 domain-containing protein [Nakamurella antarctica]
MPPSSRKADPERGFRGVMSGALILQAITVLLGLPVASTDHPLAFWEIAALLLLAAAMVGACAFVSKPWMLKVIVALQVVHIACWFIYPALGIMGIIFGVAWWTLIYFRNEYRQRLADGVLPSQIRDAAEAAAAADQHGEDGEGAGSASLAEKN